MKKGNKIKKGFTLIELITVVIIIAIMAALALPQYTRFMERGHGSTAKNALNMIRKAEATYFALNSAYTNDTSTATGLALEVPEVAKLFDSTTTANPEWNYTIFTSGTNNSTFIATATRKKGVYISSFMNITNDGNLTLSNTSIPW